MAATLTTAPPEYAYAGNPIYTTVTTGQVPTYPPNLAAIVEVFDRTTGSDVSLLRLRPPYIPTAATLNIAAAFDLSPHLPPTSQLGVVPTAFAEVTSLYKKYRVGYADSYGLSYTTESLLYSSERFAFYGATRVDALTSPLTGVSGSILTNFTGAKTLTTEQPEFLYYFAKTTDTFATRVIIQLNTGATVAVALNNAVSITANKAYVFPQGWKQLDLAAATLPANTYATGYTWQLIDGSFDVFASAQYTLDTRCYSPSVFLLFDNGLGGLTTLHGLQLIEKYATEKDTVQRVRWTDFTPTLGDFDTVNARSMTSFEVETPLLPLAECQKLILILSSNAWLIDTVNNRFLKIVIDSKELSYNSKAAFQKIRIAYRLGWEELPF